MASSSSAAPPQAASSNLQADLANPQATFRTSMGSVDVEIYLDRVPITASNFIDLAQSGFYNALSFQRVVPNFMVQFGCPNAKDEVSLLWDLGSPPEGTFKNLKTGAMEKRLKGGHIKDEHVSRDSNECGTLSMANTGRPHTAGSQFFINTANNDFLDWFEVGGSNHVVFGKVIKGLDIIEDMTKVRTKCDRPVKPICMQSITVRGLPDMPGQEPEEPRAQDCRRDARQDDGCVSAQAGGQMHRSASRSRSRKQGKRQSAASSSNSKGAASSSNPKDAQLGNNPSTDYPVLSLSVSIAGKRKDSKEPNASKARRQK